MINSYYCHRENRNAVQDLPVIRVKSRKVRGVKDYVDLSVERKYSR